MAGRAEKGIVLTTGTFAEGAKKEAARRGVAPIKLIDGPELAALCERVCVGLRIRYEIDEDFFAQLE
jgi:restriction system protein